MLDAASEGVIISSPEYVRGVPGTMKNAIGWVVSSGGLHEKPVALLNASIVATHAYESLQEILTTADADAVPEASVRVGLPTNRIAGDPGGCAGRLECNDSGSGEPAKGEA